jgi:hypothetical protein
MVTKAIPSRIVRQRTFRLGIPAHAGRLTFAGSTRMLCTKRVTDDAPDDNVWLLGE